MVIQYQFTRRKGNTMAHYNMGLNPDDIRCERIAGFKSFGIWPDGNTTEQLISDYFLFTLIQETQFDDTNCSVNPHEFHWTDRIPNTVLFEFSDGAIIEYTRI